MKVLFTLLYTQALAALSVKCSEEDRSAWKHMGAVKKVSPSLPLSFSSGKLIYIGDMSEWVDVWQRKSASDVLVGNGNKLKKCFYTTRLPVSVSKLLPFSHSIGQFYFAFGTSLKFRKVIKHCASKVNRYADLPISVIFISPCPSPHPQS